MKALSVRQPWAELIASGRKTLEIRTWTVRHRGPLLIVASLRPDPQDCYDWRASMPADGWPTGVAVCVVDLADVIRCGTIPRAELRRHACCDPGADCHAWKLTAPRRVEPIAIKGKLGLFEVADDLIKLADPSGALSFNF